MATQQTILSPSEFAWLQLGMKSLYDWQIECLESIGLQEFGGKATSVVAANGSGKTSNLVAPAVLWFLSRYPRGQVVVTSGSFRQVEKQLWPAMRVFSRRFPEWAFFTDGTQDPGGRLCAGLLDRSTGAGRGMAPQGRARDRSGLHHRGRGQNGPQ